jgi:predicted dehydrogenase
MLRACTDARVVHALGTSNRWNPSLRAIRDLAKDGRLGELRHFRGLSFLTTTSVCH